MPMKTLHKSYLADAQGFNLIVTADAHQSCPDCEHRLVQYLQFVRLTVIKVNVQTEELGSFNNSTKDSWTSNCT